MGLLFLLAVVAVAVGYAVRPSSHRPASPRTPRPAIASAWYDLSDDAELTRHIREQAMRLSQGLSRKGVVVATLTRSPTSTPSDLKGALERGSFDAKSLGSLQETSTQATVASWLKAHDPASYAYVALLDLSDTAKWPIPILYESVGGKR